MFEEVVKEVEKALSDETGERIIVRSSKAVGGGCINHASKLDTNIGALFLKWNAHCNHDMFLREAESLNVLAKASDGTLKVPRVFCAKEVNETPGFLVLEFLRSDYATLDNDEKLGRGLAQIHQYHSKMFGFYSDNYCGATTQDNSRKSNWPEFFRENRLRYLLGLIQQNRPLSAPVLRIFEKLLDKLSIYIPEESTPVLIHGDLWSGNYMTTVQGPALIDPAAYYADREMEFSIITMFGGFSPRFFAAYNEVNPLPGDWRSRNDLYQLYHVLNHYYLFGGGYLQQALSIANQYV
jgi:fructosamine-3-kinase